MGLTSRPSAQHPTGLKDGIDEDDLIAKELGSNSAKSLKGNTQWEQYREPLKAKISEVSSSLAFEIVCK